ncbi:MAG: sulfatase [Phycisphaerales bacterium]|nr:sulfatase [Phycisphaerales bacterium]MBT7170738.1 sulfatase [Phycisphaerales bacterium]
MNRRTFLRNASISAAAATTAGSLLNAEPNPKSDRPNIVFIFSDDHAVSCIGAYKSFLQEFVQEQNITPHIDSIAKNGMLFERSYCTNSICGPSRAVIQTGRHSHLNGYIANAFGQKFNGSQWTFPKALQKAGYQTAIIGKWHLGSNPQGYDYWDVVPGQGSYYNPDFKTADPSKPKGYKARKVPGYNTNIVGDLSLNWLDKKRDKSKPFMLMMQPKAPHRNWKPDLKYLDLLDDVEVPMPETFFDDYEGRDVAKIHRMGVDKHMRMSSDLFVGPPAFAGAAKGAKGKKGGKTKGALGRLTPAQAKAWDKVMVPKNEAFHKANLTGKALAKWKFQRYAKLFLACIKSVDDNVGRVLNYLKKNDLMENTIVMYSADQGFYLGEHGWFDKRWMYEESFRMPFIAMWKDKIKPDQVNTDLIQNLDYAQTFCELAGAKASNTCQGRSIVPLMKGNTPADWRKSMYYHYYEHMACHGVTTHYGVTDGRHKLIRFYIPAKPGKLDSPTKPPAKGEWQLFDIKADPNEMHNAYNDPNYAKVVERLKGELVKLRKQYKDNTGPKLK